MIGTLQHVCPVLETKEDIRRSTLKATQLESVFVSLAEYEI